MNLPLDDAGYAHVIRHLGEEVQIVERLTEWELRERAAEQVES